MAALITPIGILSFPNLFTPRPRAPGGEPVYQCSILFDEQAQRDPQFAALKKAIAECIDKEWGPGKSRDAAFCRGLRLPFRNCEEKEYAGYDIPGGVFISPWTKTKPGVIDARKQDILVPSDVYAGQLARAAVRAFPYSTPNRGVNFGLNNVQICGHGKRIDGRTTAQQDFDEVEGDDAVMADDEIPF